MTGQESRTMQEKIEPKTGRKTEEKVIRLVRPPKTLLRIPGQPAVAIRPPSGRHAVPRKIVITPRHHAGPAAAPTLSPEAGVQQTQVIQHQSFFSSRRYRIIEPIGRGGMGTVYRAHDTFLNLPVAIKFLPKHLKHDHSAIQCLKQEAAIVMRLSHENIVKLHNFEIENGQVFLVMEYVDGENLRQRLGRDGALPLDDVIAIAKSCASALGYAHQQRVLHGDLKPDNLMVASGSALKIVDFGTAFLAAGIAARPQHRYIEGTPCYMSPEQIANRPLDSRTDIYSLGLVLYELLTGSSAFPLNAGIDEILEMQMESMTVLPEEIAGALSKAVEKDREYRWKTVDEFCAAFCRAAEPYRA